MKQTGTPASLYRGGTSKALLVDRSDLAIEDPAVLHAWIRAAFGSPDRRQIDGVGGGDLLTSKFAIIGTPTHPAADIDYTFFQVGIDDDHVATNLNCGNISAAVVPFAVDRGILDLPDGVHRIAVHNTNHQNLIYSTVSITDGQVDYAGDLEIDGVPGTGYPIELDFCESVGSQTGSLLPTGSVRDVAHAGEFGDIDCTVVDMANLIIFAKAADFGLTGTEDPLALQHDPSVMTAVERLRGEIAARLGLATSADAALTESPGTPWVALVGPPADWSTFGSGRPRTAAECDLTARGFSLGLAHKAYWGTGSICTGIAAILPGSIVDEVCRPAEEGTIRIAHPSGVLHVRVDIEPTTHEVRRGSLLRTARKIMDGTVYVPEDRLN